jgi:predicted pyridoxine 5'-phosphate oxidase superfamily flavin-nucleotide-binding protein
MVKQLRNFALVPAAQTTPNRLGSRERHVYLDGRSTKMRIGSEEAAFIAARDSFYVASLGENGPPYIQYRYGPRGFLRMLDTATLGFAVFRGSRGYISNGDVPSSWRTCLSLTDYSSLRSLKIWAETEISEDLAMMERFTGGSFGITIDRIFLFHVRALDWNCSHIAPDSNSDEDAPQFALAAR